MVEVVSFYGVAVSTFVVSADVSRRRFCNSGVAVLVRRLGFCAFGTFAPRGFLASAFRAFLSLRGVWVSAS